jgi:hypothetical protein
MANDVDINIKADGSEAVKGIEEVQTGFGKMGAAFEKHRKKIAIGMTAIGGGLTALAATQIKSAQDEAIGIAKLDQALKNIGSSYDATSAAIEKQIAATQASTNYGDEVQREVLARLVQVIGDEEKALAALPAVLDASASSGKSATTVAETMSKFFAGLANQSDATGVSIEATAGFSERLAKVMGAVGGQAERTVDPLIQLKNETSDLGQEFGRVLLPFLEAILPPMTDLIRNTTAWAKENPGLAKTIAVIAAGLGAFLTVVGPILLILPGLITAIKGLSIAFAFLNASMLPVTAIVMGLTAAILAVMAVWKNWDTIVAAFQMTMAHLKTKLLEGKLVLLEWARAIADLVPRMGGAVDALDQQIEATERARDAQLEATDALREKIEAEKAAAEESKETSKITSESLVADNEKIGTSYATVADEAEKSAEKQMTWGEFVRQENARLNKIRLKQMQDQIKKEKELDAQRLADREEYQRKWADVVERASIRRITAAQEEGMAILDTFRKTKNRVTEDWQSISATMDATVVAWNQGGHEMTDVIQEWARLTDKSTDDVIQRLINLRLESDDIKGVLSAFAKETGQSFLDMASDAKTAFDTIGNSMSQTSTRVQNIAVSPTAWQSNPGFVGRENQFTDAMAARLPGLRKQLLADAMVPGSNPVNRLNALHQEQIRQVAATIAQMEGTDRSKNPGLYSFLSNVQLPDQHRAANMFSNFFNEMSGLINEVKQGRYIPAMANGGIVRRPTLAMIGERGPEAVVPLNRSGAGGINVNITVNGDIVSDDFEQRVTAAVRDAVLGGGFTGVLARA